MYTTVVTIAGEHLWPRFAEYFDMPLAPAQSISLTQMMADKGPLWAELTQEHGLKPIPFEQLVSWAYGDFVFQPTFDIVSSTTKLRQYGFGEALDSEDMFIRLFDELRTEKVIP